MKTKKKKKKERRGKTCTYDSARLLNPNARLVYFEDESTCSLSHHSFLNFIEFNQFFNGLSDPSLDVKGSCHVCTIFLHYQKEGSMWTVLKILLGFALYFINFLILCTVTLLAFVYFLCLNFHK